MESNKEIDFNKGDQINLTLDEEYLIDLLFKKNFVNIEEYNSSEVEKELIELCDGRLDIYNTVISKYKIGTKFIKLFEFYRFNNDKNTSINISNFFYLKNLCLIEPIRFEVCENISSFEKILHYCSFNDFDSAEVIFKNELDFLVQKIEIQGATAINKIGQEVMINVIKILYNRPGDKKKSIYTNDSTIEYVKYTDEDLLSVEFNTFKYDDIAMLYLYVYAMKIIFKEESETMKISNIEAICKMAFFQKNFNSNFNFQFLFEFLYTNEVNKIHNLEYYISNINKISMFKYPLSPISQVQYSLAVYKMKTFYYDEAYDILKLYNYKSERINCLISSRRFNLAEIEIKNYIKSILTNNNPYTTYNSHEDNLADNNDDEELLNINLENFDLDKSQKMKIGRLYLKLGHIKENVGFYDKSYKIYRDYPPLRAKAMYLYSKGLYLQTVEVLYEAINEIVPKNVEANYYLGASLIEIERWGEALKIFKELKYNEPMDINISKNLSLCYFMVEDTKNSLLSLKLVAKEDIKMTRMYLKLALQGKFKEEIKWVLKFIFYDKKVENCILYTLRNKILTAEELRECLLANIHVDNGIIENILNQ